MVWGAQYCRTLTALSLPSMLGPGGLPALARGGRAEYHLFAPESDLEQLRCAPAVQQLAELLPIFEHLITAPEPGAGNWQMVSAHSGAIAASAAAGAAVCVLCPDMVVSDNCYERARRLIAERGAVETHGHRVVLEDAAADLAGWGLRPTCRQLAELTIKRWHPWHDPLWWNPRRVSPWPAAFYWRVGAVGLAAHVFTAHPLLVRTRRGSAPPAGTVDHVFAQELWPDPSDRAFVTDSDELAYVELSARAQGDPNYYLDNIDAVEFTRNWRRGLMGEQHLHRFRQTARVHSADIDPALWGPVEAEAAEVARRICAP